MAAGGDAIADLLPDEDDLLYEEELLRSPYSVKMWWRYLTARKEAPAKKRCLIYERALKALPGSYKIWHAYLKERRHAVRGLPLDNPAVHALNHTYQRALVSMHKMPRIWIEYLEFLTTQCLVTRTRRLFDSALMALPITQHDRLWSIYLKYIQQPGMPVDSALRVYRRYLQLEPSHAEEYIEYLKAKGKWGEAARQLAEIVNNDTFRSLLGKSKHALWLELCDIVTRHPDDVEGVVAVEALLRAGIRRFTNEVGRLWNALADYFIRRGMFEKARDIYEEGMGAVATVRDFSLVYDALSQFEESLISARMEDLGDDEDGLGDDEPPADDGSRFLLEDDGNDLDLRIARLEYLVERRPELLSSVMLRQNPHNVSEWHKRVKLFEGNPKKQILTYTEAIKTVDPEKALGKPHGLWCAFAKFYEKHGQIDSARFIFEKATNTPYKYIDDLASVWREWSEMELRQQNFGRALDLLRGATTAPADAPDPTDRKAVEAERNKPVATRLYRSLKLWELYVDLEESLGTLESTRAAYDRILELRIATPQTVLNYALLLEENKFFEDSFQIYERGLAIFKYPHVADIWQAYLKKFVARFKGARDKVERIRDLFEQAVTAAPPKHARPIFLEYAKWEEDYGRTAKAMAVYERAAKVVPAEERLAVWQLYVKRASTFYGVAKVREVYELAIEAEGDEALRDADLLALCGAYADMERGLGEIDRARAILVHGSAVGDDAYWERWQAFEIAHGNEETFREMLRIKRAVRAAQSAAQYNATGIIPDGGAEPGPAPVDDMQALEANAEPPPTQVSGFVSAGIINDKDKAKAQAAAAADPGEIALDDEPEPSDADADDGRMPSQKAVPDTLFGGSAGRGPSDEAMGALERLKRRRKE